MIRLGAFIIPCIISAQSVPNSPVTIDSNSFAGPLGIKFESRIRHVPENVNRTDCPQSPVAEGNWTVFTSGNNTVVIGVMDGQTTSGGFYVPPDAPARTATREDLIAFINQN